jgi:hypothetical protein
MQHTNRSESETRRVSRRAAKMQDSLRGALTEKNGYE